MDEKKVKSKRKPKLKLSNVEKLLNKVRREPSPTCNAPEQLTLEGAIKQRAFANLDEAIKQTLEGEVMDARKTIKSLLVTAAEDQDELSFWLSIRMGELVSELEEAGIEVEDIPKTLADYAAWMRANLGLFQME